MTDTDTTPGPDATDEAPNEPYEYVEEVIEYKDTRRERTLLAIILVLLALLLAFLGYRIYRAQVSKNGLAEFAGVKGMVWVRSIYGWGNEADQQLITPTSVAIGPDGLIWTNSQNRHVVAFNPDGTFDRIIKSEPSTPSSPTGEATGTAGAGNTPRVDAVSSLDVDGNNNLYVCDNAAEAILQFSSEGRLKNGWSTPLTYKIAANDSRVAALTNGTLGVFDSKSGKTYFYFGRRGTGELEFDGPTGAHIDEKNYVYVADTQNRRVRKFDPTGNLVWDAGTPPDRSKPTTSTHASPTDLFQLPTGVTTDANGRVIVTDAFGYQLVVLDGETGKKIAAYGDYGSDDGFFYDPSAVAYDPDRDYFVVADTNNNRLQVFRIQGSSPDTVATTLRRLFDRPVWICCLPFILLIIALIMVLLSRRRRRQAEKAALAAAQSPPLAAPASPGPPA